MGDLKDDIFGKRTIAHSGLPPVRKPESITPTDTYEKRSGMNADSLATRQISGVA
jgi:hypothetical protein